MSDKKGSKGKGAFARLLSGIKRFFKSFSFIMFVYLMVFTIAPVTVMNLLDKYYFGNIIQDTELTSMQTQAAVLTDDVRNHESMSDAMSAGVYNN